MNESVVALIVSRINDHLKNGHRSFPNGPVGAFICNDNTRISVQAGEFYHCKPKNLEGPWTHVEIMVQGKTKYIEMHGDDVASYVPIEDVAKEIIAHGNAKIQEKL